MSARATESAIRRHLLLGWAAVAFFALAGLALEALHGLKVAAYLDLEASTRRHMWTLAHAHGTLLGLVHLGVAFTLRARPAIAALRPVVVARHALTAALILMPAGFFLGGVNTFAGDPGLGVLLVPVGGVGIVLGAVGLVAGLAAAE